jgi:hypothetical protein
VKAFWRDIARAPPQDLVTNSGQERDLSELGLGREAPLPAVFVRLDYFTLHSVIVALRSQNFPAYAPSPPLPAALVVEV